ncbi:MAG TPA: alcohol dehydrogenase catalytic domain-containing protein [Solirubrobacterales bacterium]|nr:alcohol dehydrogenase catalytic domain-containing protein [Solirubrobacterales bacterium]
MRQLTFVEKGSLEWRDAPDALLEGDGQAVVRPVALATCDLDAAFVQGYAPVGGPFAFGHECVAEVTDVGDSVTSVKPGDLVSVPFQISCGECEHCRAGRTGNCEAVPRLSMYGLPVGPQTYGGFASDAVNVPYADAMLVPIPEGVEPSVVASLSDNIPDAWRTVAPPLETAPGSPVLIAMGAGSIALYAVAIALGLGAERVDVVGGRPRDRELAEKLGANVLDEEFPDRAGFYPITVDASANPAGIACALRSTDADGICTSIGIYFEPTPLPLLDMFTQGITFVTGRPHVRGLMPEVLELVRQGRFDPDPMTVNRVGWDDAAEALSDLRAKTVVTR